MPERKRFLLRLDPAVFDAVERWAGDDLRSINAQIEYLLTDALRRSGRYPSRRARRPQPEDQPTNRPTDQPTAEREEGGDDTES